LSGAPRKVQWISGGQSARKASIKLTKKSEPKSLYILIPGGIVLPAVAAAYAGIAYCGHPNQTHTPAIAFVCFILGFSLYAAGHRINTGRWTGVVMQIHAMLAIDSLFFLFFAMNYWWRAGRPIYMYPAGILAIVAGTICISRLLMRYVAHDHYPLG
jgi:hypothetical protein